MTPRRAPADRRAAPDPAGDPIATLDRTLERFPGVHRLDRHPGVVAFSGGPDSTALLAALVRRRRRLAGPRLLAVHVDHAADPGSRARARRAARLAHRLGVPFVEHRLPPEARPAAGESREAAARQRRYGLLARVAADAGARWIATAHHRDDQAETVLLRLLFGSGLRGLGGVQPLARLPRSARRCLDRREAEGIALVRPLLSLPRSTLAAALDRSSPPLRPALDPTNRDPAVPRNRIRHAVLPALAAEVRRDGEPPLAPRLARLAARVRRAWRVVDRQLADHLGLRGGLPGEGSPIAAAPLPPPRELPSPPTPATVDRARLADLPAPLWPAALALVHRSAGVPYPPGREARRELRRQLAAGAAVGCDCGDGWRWESRGDDLVLVPAPVESPPEGFSYILVVPGEVEIAEIGLRLQLHPSPPEPWMYRGSPDRAGLDLPLSPGDRVTVRNRRPGDRIHPLGGAGRRRLKDVLVDRRVPRETRGRIPLLCIADEIAWIPGVTVAEPFRLPAEPPAGATVWVASLRTAETSEP